MTLLKEVHGVKIYVTVDGKFSAEIPGFRNTVVLSSLKEIEKRISGQITGGKKAMYLSGKPEVIIAKEGHRLRKKKERELIEGWSVRKWDEDLSKDLNDLFKRRRESEEAFRQEQNSLNARLKPFDFESAEDADDSFGKVPSV